MQEVLNHKVFPEALSILPVIIKRLAVGYMILLSMNVRCVKFILLALRLQLKRERIVVLGPPITG